VREKMTKRPRHRRAVSEVVSTLMLVAIVVTLGVIVFTFASSGLGSLTSSFAGLMSSQGNTEAEHFVVEQATFCFTTSCYSSCSSSCVLGAYLYVRNVGTTVPTISSVYAVDQTLGSVVSQFPITHCTINGARSACQVPSNNYALINSTYLSFTPLHGHTYSFTVTSSLGNSVIFYAKAT
jgi:flagellin-like protein